MLQSGIMDWVFHVKTPSSVGGSMEMTSEVNIDRFVSKTIFYPESSLPNVAIRNVVKIFKLLIVLIIISAIVLSLEVLHSFVDNQSKGRKVIRTVTI